MTPIRPSPELAPRPVRRLVPPLAAGLVMLSGLSGSGTMAANHRAEMSVRGKDAAVETTSIGCGLAPLPGLSTRRLVGCHSAELVEFNSGGGTTRGIRFSIRPSDRKISDGVRAELRDMALPGNGAETWYRISTLLPDSFPLEVPHRLVLAQWHERVRNGGPSLRPPLSHRLWNGRFAVTLWNQQRIDRRGHEGDGEILFEIPVMSRSVLYDFVYRIRWAEGNEGKIDGWMRHCAPLAADCGETGWTRIIRYRGQTGYRSEDVDGYYFKFGLYTVDDFTAPFTAIHRNTRSGASAAEVAVEARELPARFVRERVD